MMTDARGTGLRRLPLCPARHPPQGVAACLSIVAEGRKNVSSGKESVMSAFGDNKNVYCYMDDLYVYLRARAVGDAPRGRPPKKEDKPQAAKDYEASCMEG